MIVSNLELATNTA